MMFNEIFRAVEEVESVGEKLGIKPDLSHVKNKLETRTFNLVVLGQFKRGKTTFINALLGEELLPSAVVPLTAVPTILRYGAAMELWVSFKDGARKRISQEEISEYVTEVKNPKNEKNVRGMVIQCPLEFLKEVQVVDTPGVGSVYKHNTKVAFDFLPRCDVAAFLLSADQPLSEYEHAFLKEVKDHSEKTFFLLNKIDYLSPQEVEESLDFTKKVLEEDFDTRVRIYPVSAKLALEARLNGDDTMKLEHSRIQEFEKVLWDFLKREKEDIVLASSTRQVLMAMHTIITSIEIERKALLIPISELEERLGRFNSYLEEVEKRKDYCLFLFTREVKNTLALTEQDLKTLYEGEVYKLRREMDSFYKENSHLPSGKLKGELNGFVKGFIEDLFEGWIEEESKEVESKFKSALETAEDEINEIVSDIERTSSDIFEVEMKDHGEEKFLAPEIRFSFKFNYPGTTLKLAESFVLSLMPKSISHHFILKGLKGEIGELVDRHCGRAREDFTRRILESEREQKQRLEERIVAVVRGINSAILRAREMKERSTTEGEERLAILEECRERLDVAVASLET
jgi:GTPase Era involved in 16S rRNA processing